MLDGICRDKDLGHLDLWRPAPYTVLIYVNSVAFPQLTGFLGLSWGQLAGGK